MILTKGKKSTNFDDVPEDIKFRLEATGDYITVDTKDPKAITYFKSKGLT